MGFFSNLFKSSSSKPESVVQKDIKADLTLSAPVTGTLLPLEEVPDIVISEKVMGDGVAVVPESDSIVSPCDGVISRLLPTKNAFAVRTKEGIEIYVSFGIEAMEMLGEGFNYKVSLGDEVKKGDLILQADLRFLSSKLKSVITSIIVIKSSGDIAKVIAATGKCQVATTPILWISLNNNH